MKTKPKYEEILEHLQQTQRQLEQELDRVFAEKREKFKYKFRRGKVEFDCTMRELLKARRKNLWAYLRQAPLANILSAPFIYAMIIPLVFLDITLTLYQHLCFRIYGIPRVSRADYIIIDRGHLSYLNIIEKLNCVYCGYGNGMIEYAREILGRTEQYWCPIKHASRSLNPHSRTEKFFDYGDAETYREELEKLRRDWAEDTTGK